MTYGEPAERAKELITPRESLLLKYLANGYIYTRAASEMGGTEGGVKSAARIIASKLRVEAPAGMVGMALRLGIIGLQDVAMGGAAFEPRVHGGARLGGMIVEAHFARPIKLTDRVVATVKGLGYGRSHRAIAADLGISVEVMEWDLRRSWNELGYRPDMGSLTAAFFSFGVLDRRDLPMSGQNPYSPTVYGRIREMPGDWYERLQESPAVAEE